MPRLTLALLLAMMIPVAADQTEGALLISDAWVREAPKSARAGAGYMTITNNGAADDVLIGVKADFPRVMIHNTKNSDGVMRMIHVEKLVIGAGETAVFEPGGLHIMFMGLDGDGLIAGDVVEATLEFETAGEVGVSFPIKAQK